VRMKESWGTLQTVRHGRFDRFDADFASEAWKATDGFDPFSTNSAPYSCWPVFAVPYNLPPSLCMKFEFTFLCLIVPGPEAPSL
jgi:hypothetical protein